MSANRFRALGAGEWAAVAFALLQTVLAGRVVARLARTAGGGRIVATDALPPTADRVTVIVPVLNERDRLGPCLDGLLAQGPEVVAILVVDGGSDDGTPTLVADYARRDPRLRLIEAESAPAGTNGKTHNLQAGLDAADAGVRWVLTIDADVRPGPLLVRSLVAHARAQGLAALSVATRQRLSGPAEALIHPALLTTLVYRFGIPGRATSRVSEVQANGQCFLIERTALARVGGFAPTADSVCEDVTLARALASAGLPVGFAETAADDLVSVTMYAGAADAWRNWTRSLPMRDRFHGGLLGLTEVSLVQALPLPLALAMTLGRWSGLEPLRRLNVGLVAIRLGVLAGTARAYPDRPPAYWLSPLCDVPATVGVWLGVARRRHTWRGRAIVRGGPR